MSNNNNNNNNNPSAFSDLVTTIANSSSSPLSRIRWNHVVDTPSSVVNLFDIRRNSYNLENDVLLTPPLSSRRTPRVEEDNPILNNENEDISPRIAVSTPSAPYRRPRLSSSRPIQLFSTSMRRRREEEGNTVRIRSNDVGGIRDNNDDNENNNDDTDATQMEVIIHPTSNNINNIENVTPTDCPSHSSHTLNTLHTLHTPHTIPGKRWESLCPKDKFLYKESIRLLKNYLCPICREVQSKRVLVCCNGHFICAKCFEIQTRSFEMLCCMCRKPFLHLAGVPLRHEEDCILTMVQWISSLSGFRSFQWVDILVRKEDVHMEGENIKGRKSLSQLTGKWYTGMIESMDVELETFHISVVGFSETFSKHIFSDDIERLYSHTKDWRLLSNLYSGLNLDVLLTDPLDKKKQSWVGGTIVYTDPSTHRIFVAFHDTYHNDELDVKPFLFKDLKSFIALRHTFTRGSDNDDENSILLQV